MHTQNTILNDPLGRAHITSVYFASSYLSLSFSNDLNMPIKTVANDKK